MGFSDNRVHLRTARVVTDVANEFRRVFAASELDETLSVEQREECLCFEVFRTKGSPWVTIRCISAGPWGARFVPITSPRRLAKWSDDVAIEFSIYASDVAFVSVETGNGPAGGGIELPMKPPVRLPRPPKESRLEKAVNEIRVATGNWLPTEVLESAILRPHLFVESIVAPLLLLCGLSAEQTLGDNDVPADLVAERVYVIQLEDA